jgi:hypothetical protein
MPSLNLQSLSQQTKITLSINACQILLAIITLGLAAGAHNIAASASVRRFETTQNTYLLQ